MVLGLTFINVKFEAVNPAVLTMEEDQVFSPEEPQAASAASSDSFSRLWSDVMGMLVSLELGEGCHTKAT